MSTIYDASGKLTYILKSEYNAKNQLSSSISHDGNQKNKFTHTYKYDDSGNIIEDIFGSQNKDGEMKESVTTYKYNAKNQIIEKTDTLSIASEQPFTTTYQYYTQGNLLTEITEGLLEHTYAYTYDKQDNWIKKTITRYNKYVEGLTFEIFERVIIYY